MNTQTEEKQWNELALSHANNKQAASKKLHEWAVRRVEWLQGFNDQDEGLLTVAARKELEELKGILKQIAL